MGTNLIHGVLLATINSATDIVFSHRNTPTFIRKLCTCYNFSMIEECEEATRIGKGLSKLYATIDFGEARVARTRLVKRETRNPMWNESFHIYCAYEASYVTIKLKDSLTIGAIVVGIAQIPTNLVKSGNITEGWLDLFSEHNRTELRGKIYVKLQFLDARQNPSWGRGIKGCDAQGVEYTFFKQEKGNKITLYQDAHMQDGFMPRIPLAGGKMYQPTRCWEDIFKALSDAKHLIYITGWSIYSQITLVRDMERMVPGAKGVTLGQLLKRKASEGVRVLILVWDDRTSISLRLPTIDCAITTGVMHTHDEDTEAYFKGSKVHCVLCPRNPDGGASIAQGIEIGLIFTHHQKTVIVDEAVSDRNRTQRKLVSFVGGIDLCDGRYDNQKHSLFSTLASTHKEDFHQTCFEGASLKKGGPREPWHDVHSKIEGPAAWNVLYNFEQRWEKQGRWRTRLLKVMGIPSLWPPKEVIKEDDPEAWNVQIFRSIDEGAVVGLPRDPNIANALGLVVGKENTIDRSIQDAYICAVRRAKNFIYMENQYFIGSSASWSSHQDSGAIQLIPMEITQKIVSKIEAGERFSVYIVIPMWPEGVPESEAVQSILYWQRLTMEMMYKRIANELEKKGVLGQESPTDYLNFFCLGNRESKHQGEYTPPEVPLEGTDYRNAQDHRRFMIYVHAKTMIVDDEYIIVGSANCNQRSMDGGRDSEIAMGAYQPHHIITDWRPRPRGQVHGFRMSLWYEHMGVKDRDFLQPESLQCVRKVQRISKDLWGWYCGQMIVDLPAHLLYYPINVLLRGDVTSLENYELFPDTNAPVMGKLSRTLPSLLTV